MSVPYIPKFKIFFLHNINNAKYINFPNKIRKISKKKCITNYCNLSTDALIKLLRSEPFLYRKEINIIPENLSVNDPRTNLLLM